MGKILGSWINFLISAICFFSTIIISSSSQLEDIHKTVRLGKLVAAVNESLHDTIDASIPDMSKVYHEGNLCPFRRKIISKMAKSQDIEIMIVGGSVTYGADLKDRLNQRWSHRFEQIMNSGWYDGKIKINNKGVGACNIDVWIDRVPEFKSADLIIVDLSVNDQGFDLQALPHLYHSFIQLIDALPNHPALLFHQAFRTAKYDHGDIQAHCPKLEDQGTCCNGYLYCKRWWDMQDFVAIPLSQYRVPFISFRMV